MRFENDDGMRIICGHYLTHVGPWWIREDGDLIWTIRLKLSPTTENIHDFPQGVEYIIRSTGRPVPTFQPGQAIIMDRIQEVVNKYGGQVRTAIDPPILRFSDDIGFTIQSGKFVITDDFGESLTIDSLDEPIYADLKKLINEDSSILYSDHNDLNPLLNRPPKLPQYRIENISIPSEYFSIRGMILQTEYIISRKTDELKKLVITLFDGTLKRISDGRLKGQNSRKSQIKSIDIEKVPDEFLVRINVHKHGIEEFDCIRPGDLIEIINAKCKERHQLKSGQWEFPDNGMPNFILHYSGVDKKSFESKGKSSGVQKLENKKPIMEELCRLITSDTTHHIHTAECIAEAITSDNIGIGQNAGIVSLQLTNYAENNSSISDMEIESVPSSTNGITNGHF